MPDGRAASTLAGIKERQALASDASLGFSRMDERHDALIKVAYEDTPRLLAAIEAALKAAHDWERKADEADDRAEAASGRGPAGTSLMLSSRGQALHDCSFALREAITRELTGKEAGDGR